VKSRSAPPARQAVAMVPAREQFRWEAGWLRRLVALARNPWRAPRAGMGPGEPTMGQADGAVHYTLYTYFRLHMDQGFAVLRKARELCSAPRPLSEAARTALSTLGLAVQVCVSLSDCHRIAAGELRKYLVGTAAGDESKSLRRTEPTFSPWPRPAPRPRVQPLRPEHSPKHAGSPSACLGRGPCHTPDHIPRSRQLTSHNHQLKIEPLGMQFMLTSMVASGLPMEEARAVLG
jgi:hypothetical protein